MAKIALWIAAGLIIAGSVVADPSDTTKLYDGGITTYDHKRYLTAYAYRTAGIDTLEFKGWQGEVSQMIVLDTHSHSFGLRSNDEFQWSFELGAEPTSYPGADGGRLGTWNTGDSIGVQNTEDQAVGSIFTFNGTTGVTLDSLCAWVVCSGNYRSVRASIYHYEAGVDSALIDSTLHFDIQPVAQTQLIKLPVVNGASLTNGEQYAIQFTGENGAAAFFMIQTDTTDCSRANNVSITHSTQWPDSLEATITADDPYLIFALYQPYSDEMTWSFDMTYDSLTFIPEYDSWAAATDSGHWISQVFHEGYRHIGVGTWNWFAINNIYYEYQNGSFIVLGRPRLIDSDDPPDSTFGKLIVEPMHDRLNITGDTTWCAAAVYPVTIEVNTISTVCPVLTDAATGVGGYDMFDEAQIGPWAIFKGVDSSRMYSYHTYMSAHMEVIDSSGIDWALFTATVATGDADTIAPDTSIDYIEDSIYLSEETLFPPLVTALSEDSAYLLFDTVYFPAVGGEDWWMYNFMHYQYDDGVGGTGCDTCVKSYWQYAQEFSAPPIYSPFFAPNPNAFENKGSNIVWGTYIEPGGRTHAIRVSNATINGTEITDD